MIDDAKERLANEQILLSVKRNQELTAVEIVRLKALSRSSTAISTASVQITHYSENGGRQTSHARTSVRMGDDTAGTDKSVAGGHATIADKCLGSRRGSCAAPCSPQAISLFSRACWSQG